MKSRAERREIQNKLLALLDQVRADLINMPNVVDIAVGLKETNGKLTDEIVFQVFVQEKVEESILESSQIIPEEIRGYKTDVVKVPKSKKRIDSSEHRPIKGGIQIGNGKGHVGTLGCFARLTEDDTLVLLSNEHVLYSDGAEAGDKIGQSDIDHKCCCCCAYINGEIGIVLNPSFDNTTVDCAIASIKSGIATDMILNNSMTTTEIRIDGIDTAVVGDLVRKIGRTSGLTNGRINSINGTTGSGSNDKNGQIFIRPVDSETYTEVTNGKKAFSDGGDSGSVIIDEDNNIVGLLWGGDPDSFTVDETYACHINDVLDTFRDAGSEIEIEFTPPDRSAATRHHPLKSQRINLDIRKRLLETEKGEVLVRLFEIHQKEILQLINTNRKVKVTWQRHQGPAFTAHLMNSYKDLNYVIPKEVKGITLQELLIKMTAVLKEAGSHNLRESIERHAFSIIHDSYGIIKLEDFLIHIDTVDEVIV